MYSKCREQGAEMRIRSDTSDEATLIEEAEFAEWWTINILGGKYHTSSDFIDDLLE